ncbi:hypothetical protein EPI10_006455 [Gossypium australe]|uniref:Uncharacterized protein n=1 Tax=Gossypium australe TaxID=47621 RepID=A0A5B6WRA1_9ROSI|nr:hypothetical protein EPI10_006455 [Gossypium australe]
MIFPHISQTFVLGGIIHPERGLLESPHINAIHEEGVEQRNPMGICPYEPRSVLDNWIAEDLPVSLDINDMSNDNTDPEVHFEQDIMVKQEEKQILPHEEEIENITFEEGEVVKIGTHIAKETRTRSY